MGKTRGFFEKEFSVQILNAVRVDARDDRYLMVLIDSNSRIMSSRAFRVG